MRAEDRLSGLGRESWGVGEAEWGDWRWQLRHSGEAWGRLSACGLGGGGREEAQRRYPAQCTPYYLSLAASASPDDPVLRQVLPDPAELSGDGEEDPFAEEAHCGVPRLVHRYRDRALFLTTGDCAAHCRHCMRKRNWGELPGAPSAEALAAAAGYVRSHPEIREILVSGGDPLTLSDGELERVLSAFAAIPHVETLRVGSRLPAVLPQRLTEGLAAVLGGVGKAVFLACHFNHPRELTEAAAAGVLRLLRAGVPSVCQSVLLRGVNDDPETLRELLTGLLRIRVKPYCLFHGDPIRGTMHFRTGIARGLELMGALRGHVSGLAMPAFAFDLPQGGGKVRLEPGDAPRRAPDGAPVFRSFEGRDIPYR